MLSVVRLHARDAGELAIEQWEPTRVDESTVARFNEWAKFVDDDDVTAVMTNHHRLRFVMFT